MIFKHLAPKTQRLFTTIALALLFFGTLTGLSFGSDPGIMEPDTTGPAETMPTSTTVPVTIQHDATGFQLYRAGEPYFIKGVGGRRHLERAAAAGANSVRTWNAKNAGGLLDRADGLGMTVTLGIWLSHKKDDYLNPAYKQGKRDNLRKLLEAHRHHPALLMWALGNEINLQGADTPEAWQFVDELARLVKRLDPHHPVISVIAYDEHALDVIATYAPNLDAVGINAYGALSGVRRMVDSMAYHGPYLVTEWGVDGHWEVKRTDWGRPIEPTSAKKVESHINRYRENILNNSDRCIGSYVFLWGQKQERTPTWYSMFIENLPGEGISAAACPTVDAMYFNWSGQWPANRAPSVAAMTINDTAAAGDVKLTPGESFVARVTATDPDDDNLRYVWELMAEPSVLGKGGSYEPRPEVIGEVTDGKTPQLAFSAPEKSGEYRLFVYVLDENGHVGTANIPFVVDTPQTLKADNGQTTAKNG